MTFEHSTIILHAAVKNYGADCRVRCLLLAPTHIIIDVGHSLPMEYRMRKHIAVPESVTNHQKSVRVGPPQKNERGVADPLTAMYIAIGGIIYMTVAFWGIVVSMSSNTETRWF